MARVKTPKIGIAITTHNRYSIFKKCYNEIVRYAPKGAVIVVVDDASEMPVPEATYRFEQNVGIAAAKNKCFELLEKCDHIFLFDDDAYPRCVDWWKPYVESDEAHLAYIFQDYATSQKRLRDTALIMQNETVTAWTHQRGVMLYYKKIVLEKVGGMDWAFGKWGWEHVNLADRIHAAGLTTFSYMDVVNSRELIYCCDEYTTVQSSCTNIEKSVGIERNTKLYKESKGKTKYVDYKKPQNVAPEGRNIVITCYFTGAVESMYHFF